MRAIISAGQLVGKPRPKGAGLRQDSYARLLQLAAVFEPGYAQPDCRAGVERLATFPQPSEAAKPPTSPYKEQAEAHIRQHVRGIIRPKPMTKDERDKRYFGRDQSGCEDEE